MNYIWHVFFMRLENCVKSIQNVWKHIKLFFKWKLKYDISTHTTFKTFFHLNQPFIYIKFDFKAIKQYLVCAKNPKKKGYLLDDIFPKCEHLDQNENYEKIITYITVQRKHACKPDLFIYQPIRINCDTHPKPWAIHSKNLIEFFLWIS